jgi:hypothetical protein
LNIAIFITGTILIAIILGDAFETMVLPRRVTRRVRLARLFFRSTWIAWLYLARLIKPHRSRDTFLGFFGPLSVIMLIILWATGLIVGFTLMHWAFDTILKTPEGVAGFGTYLYLSGTTFFTLGMGDIVPGTALGRGLAAFESGMGFGFLALVISYLPLLNQSFARREIAVSLLDSHAGSPPAASEMLLRHIHQNDLAELNRHFHDWERWSAELLESLLSYPILAFFRSHHDNQSWLGSLTAILDASAIVMAATEGVRSDQARFTFAMTRHTIVDLAQVFSCPPYHGAANRLPNPDFEHLYDLLSLTGLNLPEKDVLEQNLAELRMMYEPHVHSLSRFLHIPLPPWLPKAGYRDNWQTTPWGAVTDAKKKTHLVLDREDHF